MSPNNAQSKAIYALQGLHCQACVKRVSAALAPFSSQPGGVQVTLSPMQATLLDTRATLEQLQAAVTSAGNYALKPLEAAEIEEKVLSAQIESAQTAIYSIANTMPLGTPQSPKAGSAPIAWLQTYRPLLLILAFILGASLLVQLGQYAGHGMDGDMGASALSGHETMRYFMAGFFLVFTFFKLLDIQAFADAYAGYDLLAARWRTWGLIYPFVELALGIAYLANIAPIATAWVTILVMGFSAIGVIRAVLDKRSIRCACLGSVFNLPMSQVTIVEDVGMVLMALAMLVWNF